MTHFSKVFASVDAVVFRTNDHLEALLINRGVEPYLGKLALPGGHLEETEEPEAGCRRELLEETGLSEVFLLPLMFYGDVQRDPRYRNISLAFVGLTRQRTPLKASSDVSELKWASISEVGDLAFDHNKIFSDAIRKLRAEASNSDVLKYLLGDSFSISRMQKIYEELFSKRFDKRNFRRKARELNILEEIENANGKNTYKFKPATSWPKTFVS